MKRLTKRLISGVLLCGVSSFLLASVFLGHVGAEEISARLSNPFMLPQTSFFAGNVNYTTNLSNSSVNVTGRSRDSSINVYGFDIEINASDFMNIGGFFRVESIGSVGSGGVTPLLTTLLGGFARFFYVPPLLKGKTFTSGLFTRVELGVGPMIMGEPSGLIGETGIHIGIETYVSKWIGLSVSYGQIFQLGKETLASGVAGYESSFKNATIWSQGQMLLVSLKTTFF